MRVGLALILVSVAVACSSAPRSGKSEIRGAVAAMDEKAGVICEVEINAQAPPLIVPIYVEATTGSDFTYVMSTTGSIRNMYAAARCEGYATALSQSFDLEPGRDVDLGTIVVSPR